MKKIGVQSIGLIAPIIRKGDNLAEIVTETVLDSGIEIENGDVIGITESVVARAQGNYVTIDELTEEIKKVLHNPENIHLASPIYSRNRFAMILKAFARAAKKAVYIYMPEVDEVGNVLRNHPFTGLNYDYYYRSIVEAEGKICGILSEDDFFDKPNTVYVDCRLHLANNFDNDCFTLKDFCKDKCYWGLLGSNKASEEKLKLFPSFDYADDLVNDISDTIFEKTGKCVEVMVYGDGCFKDPVGGIWEFADPEVAVAYTEGLEGTPNELKLKNLADEKFADLNGSSLEIAIYNSVKEKEKDLKGEMASQGTTPRRYTDLLGSLMDLTSGSGDKGTPIVYIKGYFDNFATNNKNTYDKVRELLNPVSEKI